MDTDRCTVSAHHSALPASRESVCCLCVASPRSLFNSWLSFFAFAPGYAPQLVVFHRRSTSSQPPFYQPTSVMCSGCPVVSWEHWTRNERLLWRKMKPTSHFLPSWNNLSFFSYHNKKISRIYLPVSCGMLVKVERMLLLTTTELNLKCFSVPCCFGLWFFVAGTVILDKHLDWWILQLPAQACI